MSGAVTLSSKRTFTRCILCGCPTVAAFPVWLDPIRVLYQKDEDIVLSGVFARHHVPDLDEKLDRSVRWIGDYDEWHTRHCKSEPEDGCFLFHEQCWRYSRKVLEDSGITLKELHGFFQELPLPKDPGIVDIRDYHPCYTPSLEEIKAESKSFPLPSSKGKTSINRRQRSTDLFDRLPFELRQAIGVLISTEDFYNLRYASRAMAVIIHDNGFWRSHLQEGWQRAIFDFVTSSNPAGVNNWRQVYHMTSRNRAKLATTVRVWEILQWIKEKHQAQNLVLKPPLEYCGAALQYYRSDRSLCGRRVERVRVCSQSLTHVGVSFISGPKRCRSWNYDYRENIEAATQITAIEFIYSKGASVILGRKNPGASERTLKSISASLSHYHGRRNKEYLPPLPCPFDSPGVHILFPASSFRGFRMSYNVEGIYTLGVLGGVRAYEPLCHGINGIQSCNIDLAMNDVREIVATFEVNLWGDELWLLHIC
ncbi:hypothetical protein BJY04DRAFT_217849 [Aspergillus karnatakaensis]|uniref:uncharacterized protein n=1 Tax=Aspergillus karnatakaensis TaxID=1810916 RepID=UPI003CCCB9FE